MENTQKKELFLQAWKEVLGVKEAGDDDNFFEVGGDSVKGVQLVAWLAQKGLKLDMLKLYTEPTVSQLVNELEEAQPLAVPAEMLTKENFSSFIKDPVAQKMMQQATANGQVPPMNGQLPPAGAPQQPMQPMQLCTPMQPMQSQQPMQLCTPMQLCIPMQQQPMQPMQLCTPMQPMQQMPSAPQGGAQPFMAMPVNAPIENPVTMKINEPHLGPVTKSPEDALDTVLSGIFQNGYDKQANLFEQGLDSLKMMQIVTRCGEQGYRVNMQGIMKDPTFKGIIACMKTE